VNIETKVEKLLKDHNGVIKTADAVEAGISRTTLGELVKNGKLERMHMGNISSLMTWLMNCFCYNGAPV